MGADRFTKKTENQMQAIVIDDSRAMRGILKRVLTNMGIESREAADGKLGLIALADAEPPHSRWSTGTCPT